MFNTLDPVEVSHPSMRRFFKVPAIFAVLTAIAFAGIAIGGIGPCGGDGVPFLLAFIPLGVTTVIAFAIACGRALTNHRRHREV